MGKLEDLQPNVAVRGILPDALVTIVNVQWFGSDAVELTYKTPRVILRTSCSTEPMSRA
jgi:Fe2+ transport system protein FeoA